MAAIVSLDDPEMVGSGTGSCVGCFAARGGTRKGGPG